MSIADPATVREHLLAAAAGGHPLTYSELLARLGHDFSRPKMRALCKTLAAVDEAAEADGEPELAVLVVRQSDGLPPRPPPAPRRSGDTDGDGFRRPNGVGLPTRGQGCEEAAVKAGGHASLARWEVPS